MRQTASSPACQGSPGERVGPWGASPGKERPWRSAPDRSREGQHVSFGAWRRAEATGQTHPHAAAPNTPQTQLQHRRGTQARAAANNITTLRGLSDLANQAIPPHREIPPGSLDLARYRAKVGPHKIFLSSKFTPEWTTTADKGSFERWARGLTYTTRLDSHIFTIKTQLTQNTLDQRRIPNYPPLRYQPCLRPQNQHQAPPGTPAYTRHCSTLPRLRPRIAQRRLRGSRNTGQSSRSRRQRCLPQLAVLRPPPSPPRRNRMPRRADRAAAMDS